MERVTEKAPLDLEGIAQDIASRQAGLMILETKEWILPVAASVAKFTPPSRQSNSLEEFVLKCITSGLPDLKNKPGIAGFLRIDEALVSACLTDLHECGLLAEQGDDGYDLTPKGREACETGRIAAKGCQAAVLVTVNAQYELVDTRPHNLETVSPDEQNLPLFRYANRQEELLLRDLFWLSAEETISLAQQHLSKAYAENPAGPAAETQIIQLEQDIHLHYGEIWVYDIAADQVNCLVWDFAQANFCQKLAHTLMVLEAETRLAQALKQRQHLEGLFLKQLETQLHQGYLADKCQCLTWFAALLRLREHSYIREVLAEEALEQVIANQPVAELCDLLQLYVKANEYELGFAYLLDCLMQPEHITQLTAWLENLYIRDYKAYCKVTAVYRTIRRQAR